jgi:hypothetical protein
VRRLENLIDKPGQAKVYFEWMDLYKQLFGGKKEDIYV